MANHKIQTIKPPTELFCTFNKEV
ncbi:MAG: hypothetical protein RI893_1725, partial [Pseudomonadota bacterium]